MNYFASLETAKRYATSRPYFHPVVMEQLQAQGIHAHRALDVGCGTGLSSRALSKIADHIIGFDLAEAMVTFAQQEAQNEDYLTASGEEFPFPATYFDLVTVSSVFHWLDRKKFMAQTHRVLKPGGHLVVYDNYFQSQMQEDAHFQDRFKSAYFTRYPSPRRAPVEFSSEDGFEVIHHEIYTNDVEFTQDALTFYLMTQSNVIAQLENGRESFDSAYAWIHTLVAPYFPEGVKRTFRYKGPIWILKPHSTGNLF